MIQYLKNLLGLDKYKNHSEAIIVSCFYNPQNSEYRLKAFHEYYKTIKHLNHIIVECLIGDAQPQLTGISHITVKTDSLLWHKEGLINQTIKDLPKVFKYIFWVDADVLFTNKNWMTEGVNAMKNGVNILQPFEYCVHMEKDELKPSFDYNFYKKYVEVLPKRHKRLWRSFCANYTDRNISAYSNNYDIHGHVGFAWGAKRSILEAVPLYDKALIGGADHIIAHAAAGQINHSCIRKTFTETIDDVNRWSRQFYEVAQGKIGYVTGDLFHIWHGHLEKRDYYNRIKTFDKKSSEIVCKDENGLYVNTSDDVSNIMTNYFQSREDVSVQPEEKHFGGFEGGGFGGAGAGGNWNSNVPVTKAKEGDSLVMSVVTAVNSMDTNHDGVIDFRDTDINHNGVPDAYEADFNHDGIPDSYEGSTFS